MGILALVMILGFIASSMTNAAVLVGKTTCNAPVPISVSVEVNGDAVTIRFSGISDRWHAVGFGQGGYIVISDVDNKVKQNNLKADYSKGTNLPLVAPSSWKTVTDPTMRNTTFTRPRSINDSAYFSFPNTSGATFRVICGQAPQKNQSWADASGMQNYATSSITLSEQTNIKACKTYKRGAACRAAGCRWIKARRACRNPL